MDIDNILTKINEANLIKQGLSDIKNGKLVDGEKLLNEMRSKLLKKIKRTK